MDANKNHIVRILEKAKKGVRISPDEARELFQSHDLLLLGRYANVIARKKNGKVISYVVDRNINYTNICIGGCHFCAFSRKQDAPDAYLLTYDEIKQKVSELLSVGGTQVLLQGGLHPTLPLRWYTDLISNMKKKFPVITVERKQSREYRLILTKPKSGALTVEWPDIIF